MKRAKTLLALLLVLTLTVGLCAVANAAGEAINYRYVDTDGNAVEGSTDGSYSTDTALTLEPADSHPEFEGYTYKEATLNGETLTKLTITPAEGENPAVITATMGDGSEKALVGGETILFVYEKAHEHDFGEGTVTTEPGCLDAGVRTFTCECGETKTEEIKALGHDWGEPEYTWSEDGSSCTARRTCKRDANHYQEETITASETANVPATCAKEGSRTMTAAFTNPAFTEQSTSIAIPTLAHDFENGVNGHCKNCSAIDPSYKPVYGDFTRGTASWGSNYACTSTASYGDFLYMIVDGETLPRDQYDVTEGENGCTVVYIKGDFIKTLAEGQHRVIIVSESGSAAGHVMVSEKPRTGDENSLGLWVLLTTASALCGGVVIAYAHRKLRCR